MKKDDRWNYSELVAYTDIDNTLVSECNSSVSHTKRITLDFYGELKEHRIHFRNIQQLISLKKRGYTIIAWSGNGAQWVKEVIEKLEHRIPKFEGVISRGGRKPEKYLDDLPCEEWMGARIDLKEDE